jgi:hypothetical protein
MQITGKVRTTVELTKADFGREILRHVASELKQDDEEIVNLTWKTWDGHIYVGEHEIGVSPTLATLVDAANIFIHGSALAAKAQHTEVLAPVTKPNSMQLKRVTDKTVTLSGLETAPQAPEFAPPKFRS